MQRRFFLSQAISSILGLTLIPALKPLSQGETIATQPPLGDLLKINPLTEGQVFLLPANQRDGYSLSFEMVQNPSNKTAQIKTSNGDSILGTSDTLEVDQKMVFHMIYSQSDKMWVVTTEPLIPSSLGTSLA